MRLTSCSYWFTESIGCSSLGFGMRIENVLSVGVVKLILILEESYRYGHAASESH